MQQQQQHFRTVVETERIIAGSIRKSAAYCDHAAAADALREYLGKRAASQSILG